MRGATIEVRSAMENRYRRKTVLGVPTFYITHYLGCRFEHAENIFAKKIQIHIKAIPNMILSANKLRLSENNVQVY